MCKHTVEYQTAVVNCSFKVPFLPPNIMLLIALSKQYAATQSQSQLLRLGVALLDQQASTHLLVMTQERI